MWRRWLKVDEYRSNAAGKSTCEVPQDDGPGRPGVSFTSGKGVEYPEDDISKEWVVGVLCSYTQLILRSFIYPESRARFIRMLQGLGLDSKELQHSLEVDFWSIAHP